MKKIELHLHLDGSVRENTLKELLLKENIKTNNPFHVLKSDTDLNDYLKKFDYPLMVMQTKDNLTRIAQELVYDLEEDGVIYAEVRFAPIKHLLKGLTLKEVVLSVLNGLSKGNIKVNLILCCMRDSSLEDNLKIVDLADYFHLAVDLAGAEAIYKTESFHELFFEIQKRKLHYTIHAGEASGKESILSAILFNTPRIGHGIKEVDEEIIALYLKNNITLEVCPTSNLNTHVVSSIEKYPIYDWYQRGVKITINTDNRTISNTTLTKEYELLQSVFPFTQKDFMKMNEYAIDAAFLTDEEKKQLKCQLKEKI